ncbi:MAG: triphosphoribosyl-dephospho-CoA synthase, partial [Pseudomonadota bacterium]
MRSTHSLQVNINDFEKCYLAACRLELQAIKPGNVGLHANGHGMTVEQFELSASASAPQLFQSNATVGERILHAVQATRESVGDNTNLGIILLIAPLAQALIEP